MSWTAPKLSEAKLESELVEFMSKVFELESSFGLDLILKRYFNAYWLK